MGTSGSSWGRPRSSHQDGPQFSAKAQGTLSIKGFSFKALDWGIRGRVSSALFCEVTVAFSYIGKFRKSSVALPAWSKASAVSLDLAALPLLWMPWGKTWLLAREHPSPSQRPFRNAPLHSHTKSWHEMLCYFHWQLQGEERKESLILKFSLMDQKQSELQPVPYSDSWVNMN